MRYQGFDIVPEVVEADRAAFGTDNVSFGVADVRSARLPAADLLVCKDVLQHWDLASVEAFLARHLGRYRYALITNDIASVHIAPETLNTDIPIGHWRPLDLELPPFGLRVAVVGRYRHPRRMDEALLPVRAPPRPSVGARPARLRAARMPPGLTRAQAPKSDACVTRARVSAMASGSMRTCAVSA